MKQKRGERGAARGEGRGSKKAVEVKKKKEKAALSLFDCVVSL